MNIDSSRVNFGVILFLSDNLTLNLTRFGLIYSSEYIKKREVWLFIVLYACVYTCTCECSLKREERRHKGHRGVCKYMNWEDSDDRMLTFRTHVYFVLVVANWILVGIFSYPVLFSLNPQCIYREPGMSE
jgi:hypothetical protein